MMHTKDTKWAALHFDELVEKYGGLYVGIFKTKVLAYGKTPSQVIVKSKLRDPQQIYFFKVPTKKDLVCLF